MTGWNSFCNCPLVPHLTFSLDFRGTHGNDNTVMEPQSSGFYRHPLGLLGFKISGAATAAIPRGLRPLGMAAVAAPSILAKKACGMPVKSLTFRLHYGIVPLYYREVQHTLPPKIVVHFISVIPQSDMA